MGLADAVVTQLYAARRRSDLEMQLSMILERKLAVQDRCNEISAKLANNIFQSDNHDNITNPSATYGTVPGSSGFIPALPAMPQDYFGGTVESGDTINYERQLAKLQQVEKQLDTQQKKMETELEAVKAEEESFKKIAHDHAKNGFKIGG
ncbi:MAG: hypothetical protein GX568_03365 [Candidatus Gastranaerophilales bacterium]|nr:hypothetical protein [Candidatus Gastranaerophilales bacterium]